MDYAIAPSENIIGGSKQYMSCFVFLKNKTLPKMASDEDQLQ